MRAKSSRFFLLYLVCLLVLISSRAAQAATDERAVETERLQRIVDELKHRLGIEATVAASVVPVNPLVVSVQPIREGQRAFMMSFQDGFAGSLADDDLRAVVAHELGHVWIFLHHPYLQTERLANDVALRVVTRESLARVYERLAAAGVMKGDLTRFLGQ